MHKAAYYIQTPGPNSHAEGGSFRKTYRPEITLPHSFLETGFKGARQASTGIYFLLEYGQFGAFHKIASDEMWHFYEGCTLSIYEIDTDGLLYTHKLGRNTDNGEEFQCVIKAGNWFASRCEVEKGFSLVGCTVSPGFDFEDFELAEPAALSIQFPQHAELIYSLTHNNNPFKKG